jgi:hypothetical protein
VYQLSGHQLKALRETLIAAFPDEGDLEEMVLDELDERLNTIAQEKNYRATVRKFVEWAEAQGKLREVVIGASRVNPGNPELRTFISEAFETLLNAPDLLPQDLMDTLLLCLRQLQNFSIVAQCCRLTVPGVQTHRSHIVEAIEEDRLGIDVRWLMVLELLFHAYPKQSGDIPTIVEFVDRLQRQSELSVESRTALAQWLSQVVARCNYRLSSHAQFQDDNSHAQTVTALQGYLLITVKQKITGEGFLVHGFLIVKTIRQNDFTQSQLIPIEDLSSALSEQAQHPSQTSQKGVTCALEEIQERLLLWVRRSEEYLIDQGTQLVCGYDLTVEFFLPYEYLAVAVDLWNVQTGLTRARRFIPVGRKHRVVVRSLDRLDAPDLLNELIRVWQWAEPLVNAQSKLKDIQERCEPLSQLDLRNLRKLVPRLRQCFALKLTCAIPERQQDREELFLSLLESGVPIALWCRQSGLVNVNINEEFDRLLASEYLCNLDRLLEQIRQKRENAHVEDNPCEYLGYHLGILCDEPKRLGRLSQFIKENNLWGRSA